METCRTCAKCDFNSGNGWLDLFHPMRWEEEIAHVRMELSNWKLKVIPNDGLPQKICTDCFTKFCDVYAFRVECQQAQIKLSNIFDKIEEQNIESEDSLCLSEVIERECERLLPSVTEEELANNEDTLLKIFDLNGSSLHLNEPFEFNALKHSNTCEQRTDQGSKSVSETTISDISLGLSTTTTTTITTAHNDKMNEEMITTQQQLDEIQKDLSNQFSDDDEEQDEDVKFNDIIEEVVNDEELEHLSISLSMASPSEHDESMKNLATVTNDFSLTFECKYCYKSTESFVSQQLLLAHITSEHDAELPFTCPHCQHGFRDAASRTVHVKDKHVEKHHACGVCRKKYADRSNLRHHIEKYHSENDFECTLCEKRFYSRKSLKYHMKWHDPGLQLKCNYCDRLFINRRHLECHEATHNGKLRNCEYCSFCGKSFIHLKTLRWHIYRKHGGEKPYKCSNCTEAFTSYREKRIHMLEYHLENLTTLEKSECMLCHTHFETEKELKQHMTDGHKPKKAALIISNNKRVLQNKRRKSFNGIFQCEVCSQRFNMKTALERHMNVHTVEGRPHACPQCPKRFKRIQDMKWHMKTHSNNKANICDVCGKGFALKYVLTQHQRSHEVLEKNFKCEICGRAYLFEKSLRVHERVHTGKTYYKCDLCSESFVTHIKLKYHMSKKHRSVDNLIELPLDELVNIVIPGTLN